MRESQCIFCQISNGTSPAHIVWKDADHVAFLDINPITSGHVLLIPRTHVTWVEDLSPDSYAKLFACVRTLAPRVAAAAGAPHTGIAIEGYGVPHVHVHLVPVWRGGDLDPCRQSGASDAELEASAARLRSALDSYRQR
jgi:histidine triad (HIT) family protein